jgi:hypothetical protein
MVAYLRAGRLDPGETSLWPVAWGARLGRGIGANTPRWVYVPAFLEQVLASVACNATHSLKQRLARWLLAMRDRVEGDQLFITQDLLADMLGAYRPSITHVARELERAGLIERGRRHIKILDREGLRKESCECYDLVRDRISSYLPRTYPSPL